MNQPKLLLPIPLKSLHVFGVLNHFGVPIIFGVWWCSLVTLSNRRFHGFILSRIYPMSRVSQNALSTNLGNPPILEEMTAATLGVISGFARRHHVLHSSFHRGLGLHRRSLIQPLLVDALKKRGVSERVLEWAKEFTCPICEERKRPAPRRVANLEVIPKRWKVVLADCAVWRDPRSEKRLVIGLVMDQGSRFLVGKILVEGGTKNVQADQYVDFYQQHWQSYFGNPEVLRFDAEGTWRSRKLDEYFSRHNVMLDPVPGDAHWRISPLERSVAWLKELLTKNAMEESKISTKEIVANAIAVWNQREMVRGIAHFSMLWEEPRISMVGSLIRKFRGCRWS